jgi:trans-2,3-dihydro-3-hydroxyanthranilate isomerase
LKSDDLDEKYPVEVVSTGLPYVLLPLIKNISNAKIVKEGLEKYIEKHYAKFVYLFDTQTLECRTWDNTGLFEDVATGSAAGPLIAYFVQNRSKKINQEIKITQGTYLGRKSTITGWVTNDEVFIEGKVAFFGNGEISI